MKSVLILNALLVASSLFGASQIWTNAPVDPYWTNINNWIARAVPGSINNSNNNVVNADIATFNDVTFGGIGSAANPILIDDATIGGGRSRFISGIVFSNVNCGAFVINSLSPANPPVAFTSPGTGILNVSHNGAIRMDASVNNSQVIMVPMRVNLPSSTPGVFNLVNNSTNSGATLTINSITHSGATTRATTFVLDGTNTGNNVVTNLSEGTGNATGGFTKQGPGTWLIAGTSLFPGASPINIVNGTLAALVPDALGAATTAIVTNLGVLRLDGVTLNQVSLNLRNGGTIRANGTLSLNGVAVGNQAATTATLATTANSDVFTIGTLIAGNALVSGGAADTVLNTVGPGAFVFGQANTYVGRWSFNAKTNQIINPSALGTGANANVSAGAIFDTTIFGASSFLPTTTGFGGSGTGSTVGTTAAAVVADPGGTLDLTGKNVNLTFTPTSFAGDTTHPALYIAQGSLALSGNTFFINNASGTPLGVGTYRIIQQASGGVTSGGGYAALISGSGAAGGTTASIQVVGGDVNLVIAVYVPKNLVWTGGSLNANWNVAGDANWLNGGVASVFNNSDNATFNSVGSTNPTVNLLGTLAPATLVVDTSANDYTFTGSGQVGGATALTKKSAGVLNLGTVNSYAGGTVISNGTVRIAVNNAIPNVGSGDVAIYGNGVLDLNALADVVNALTGNGTVDSQVGGLGALTVGANNNSGVFSGVIRNTGGGQLTLTKNGNGTQTLTSSNSFTSATVAAGTLVAGNSHALGSGDVIVNNGALNLQTDQFVNSLAGTGGTIANNSNTSTNTVVIQGATTTTFGGQMNDGTGGGGLALKLLGGSLTMSGVNGYSGGTIVAGGATFGLGNAAGVTGALIASNGATISQPGGGATAVATPTSITTVDGGTVTFQAGAEGKIWNGQFIGAANTTNRFISAQSAGGNLSFQNFLGVAQIALAAGNFRFFNDSGISGGNSTRFEFIGGNIHVRGSGAAPPQPQTVFLGEVAGGSATCGIGGPGTAGAITFWIIGGKNTDSSFEGYINGATNNLVKAGTGRLTLDGAAITTNTDLSTFTNYLYAPLVTYPGSTTVSNGVLALVVPNNLSNSVTITLAASTAVLDVSQMGFISDQIDPFTLLATNQVLVTNGVIEIVPTQILSGLGTIRGSLIADAGSTLNPGNAAGAIEAGTGTGVLNVTNTVSILGAVNMRINRANSVTADEITAVSFSIDPGATLVVTNVGPNFLGGEVFHLFNHPVNFATVTLPTVSSPLSVSNRLSIDGSIRILGQVNPNPTNITFSVTSGVLSLGWPTDHIGWTLQTNAVSILAADQWFPYPGSSATNTVSLPMQLTRTNVFFRLIYQ